MVNYGVSEFGSDEDPAIKLYDGESSTMQQVSQKLRTYAMKVDVSRDKSQPKRRPASKHHGPNKGGRVSPHVHLKKTRKLTFHDKSKQKKPRPDSYATTGTNAELRRRLEHWQKASIALSNHGASTECIDRDSRNQTKKAKTGSQNVLNLDLQHAGAVDQNFQTQATQVVPYAEDQQPFDY